MFGGLRVSDVGSGTSGLPHTRRVVDDRLEDPSGRPRRYTADRVVKVKGGEEIVGGRKDRNLRRCWD